MELEKLENLETLASLIKEEIVSNFKNDTFDIKNAIVEVKQKNGVYNIEISNIESGADVNGYSYTMYDEEDEDEEENYIENEQEKQDKAEEALKLFVEQFIKELYYETIFVIDVYCSNLG
jgi:anionic cell wall polymer biosynthesis LytR-Cps2A-Psr (LCP) family protein